MVRRSLLLCSGLSLFASLQAADQSIDTAYKKVSKKVSLGQYVPHDIVTFNGVKISKRIVPDLKKLLEAAKKDGIALKVVSGYRSYEYQDALFKKYVRSEIKKNPRLTVKQARAKANSFSAEAGHSEHQLGTVVDVLSAENKFQFSSDPSLAYVGWLEKHASRYNFKISYPKDSKEYIYEPWHIRWYPPVKKP